MNERQVSGMHSTGMVVNHSIRIDVLDHLHGEDAVPMALIDSSDVEDRDAAWFRYVLECPRNDRERFAIVLRVRTGLQVPGFIEAEQEVPTDDLPA